MGFQFKKYKTKFRYALNPIFAMLTSKKKDMEKQQWDEYVKKTHERILRNPVDFLGTDLPNENLMTDILDEIFRDFAKDLIVRKMDTDL